MPGRFHRKGELLGYVTERGAFRARVVQSGALHYRGTSGTDTTVGPAEPHCPVCGSDFCQEWKSEKYGHLVVCMKCLARQLGQKDWIHLDEPTTSARAVELDDHPAKPEHHARVDPATFLASLSAIVASIALVVVMTRKGR